TRTDSTTHIRPPRLAIYGRQRVRGGSVAIMTGGGSAVGPSLMHAPAGRPRSSWCRGRDDVKSRRPHPGPTPDASGVAWSPRPGPFSRELLPSVSLLRRCPEQAH